MPYYCTVPRCTSMAGKAKNVSFHQFPRDEELAKLWNEVLKRGKPYTKYSKVCSLHFRPEDYTITSVGKNKGQWRTLRKHAVPSQNLPLESPPVHYPRRTSTGMQGPSIPPNLMDPQIQQQVAQAIYVQTMLAMQAANYRECNSASEIQPNLLAGQNGSKVSPNFSNSDLQSSDKSNSSQSSSPRASGREISELELFLLKYNMPKNFPFPQLAGKSPENLPVDSRTAETEKHPAALPIDDRITESAMFLGKIPAEGKFPETSCLPERLYKDRFSRRNTEYGSVHSTSMTHAETYQCQECSKCFKDPDVFVLHKRTHIKTDPDIQIPHSSVSEKENVRINFDSPLDLDKNLRQQTLKSNPILANLLKSSERPKVPNPPSSVANNVLSLESQIMTAMAINMEAYVRSLMASKMVADADDTSDSDSVNQCDNQDLNESKDSNRLVIDETV